MLPWIRKIFRDKTLASIILVVAFFVFLPMLSVGAQGDTFGLQEIDATVELANQDFRVIASKIIRAVLGLLGIIALVLALYAGYTIMTSAGSEEKIADGKKILTNAVIGLIIIMSAFTIVQFVINALTDATGLGGNDDGSGGKPKFSTFTGSGGLGSIIKDHYPMRGQTAVPRNTKIAITFFDPIDPASLIVDTNKSCWDVDGKPIPMTDPNLCQKYAKSIPAKNILEGQPKIYYGDCLDLNDDGTIDSVIECDHLNPASLKIYKSADSDLQPPAVYEATAMAAYEVDATGLEKTYTFVFKPEEFLGSADENVWHTVYLTGGDSPNIGVKKADGTDLFYGQFSSHYEWNFETNTIVDFSAPHVVATYPAAGAQIPRNSVVQVYYNEAIDPIVAQGAIGGDDDYENAIFSNSNLAGRWKIVNGYTTMEFVPSIPCGTNSCGGIMYCLAIDCALTDLNCQKPMTALVRTAELLDSANKKSFLAQPLGQGIMDMAGNALDNGPDNKFDNLVAEPHKPAVGEGGNPKLIGAAEKAPDNYWWEFVVKNEIDRTAPNIERVEPGIDTEGVKGLKPVTIDFSKMMMISNLPEGVKLEEYPPNQVPPGGTIDDALDAMPIAYRSFVVGGPTPKLSLNLVPGRDFGPNNMDLYYLTAVSSSIQSVNMNCLYPGRGPESKDRSEVDSPVCSVVSTPEGEFTSSENCIIQGEWDAETDTGCSITNGDASFNKKTAKIDTCIKEIKTPTTTAINPKN